MYREQYLLQKAYSNRKVFKYFVGDPPKSDYSTISFVCLICEKHNYSLAPSWCDQSPHIKDCFPQKRITISGFLFWKKKCPIDGFHKHYICSCCKTHTIKHNEKANSLIFSEAPLIGPDLSHIKLK